MDEKNLLDAANSYYRQENYHRSYICFLELSLLVDQHMDAGSYAEMAAACLQRLDRNDEAVIWLERANIEQPNFPPYEEALAKAKRGEMIE